MPALTVLLALLSCHGPEREPVADSPLFDVPQSEQWTLPGLHGPAYVLRVEGNIPRIYATDREDIARVHGFVFARDRFFVLDLARRLSTGRVSALLGDAAFASDAEARASGMTHVAHTLDRTMSDEHRALSEAFVGGVNAYIEAVRAGQLPPPSEYGLAAPLLGEASPADMMQPFVAADVAAMGATLVYELGFETGDVGNQAARDALEGTFTDAPLADLRVAGLMNDIWGTTQPVFPVTSGDGWGLETRAAPPARPRPNAGSRVPAALSARLDRRMDALQARLGRDHELGWGSNAWAVMGEKTPEGRALLAGDGHLPLTVPSLFWAAGFDTQHLGGGDTHQVGLVLPGLPGFIAVGTNGQLAWSQTQLMGDITDWYRESLVLDDAGAPVATRFGSEDRPLVAIPESVEIADIPDLGSVGRTESWTRYTTYDGRFLVDIEGDVVEEGAVPGDGQTIVRLGSVRVIPRDTDDDDVITAISFDYTGLDDFNVFRVLDKWGHAGSVEEARDASRGLVAYSQNIVFADASGSVLYTGYQAVPCRDHLDRATDGSWAEGADPNLLIDGTRFGGFTIPVDANYVVDESQGADPQRCVVPFEAYPQSLDPERGYVLTANNDPNGASLDGALWNDDWYIGGPWTEGYRADTIDRTLAGLAEGRVADVAAMQDLQAEHTSRLGEQWALTVVAALDRAAAADPSAEGADGRLAALWAAEPAALAEVAARLTLWAAHGHPAASGVDTFYDQPDDTDREDAVATTLFNAWLGHFVRGSLDDEGLPNVWQPSGSTGRMRLLTWMIDGRGAGNPRGLASWNPATEESVFFDVKGTEVVETSDEIIVLAMIQALDHLRSPPTDDGIGGFGTEDMDAWLWGLRHWVHFDSILGEFLGDDPTFGFLVNLFSITPNRLPVVDGAPPGDDRNELPGYPRPGDNFAVDAANAGMNGRTFQYGSGPVFRMVVALGPDGVTGANILPGGQSGLTDSPNFDDQAELWLGNDAWPLRFTVEEVVAGATARESYVPTP